MTKPASPPAKLTAEERRAGRLKLIRLQMVIGQELDDRGITTPAEIGVALGVPPAEATKLLTRNQWREGDFALLEAAAARLGAAGAEAGPTAPISMFPDPPSPTSSAARPTSTEAR